MVHGDHGGDVLGEERVDQIVVVGDSLFAHVVREARGEDAGHRDGETIDFDVEFFDEFDVLFDFVVGVAGDVAVAVVGYFVGLVVGEGVPNAFAFI